MDRKPIRFARGSEYLEEDEGGVELRRDADGYAALVEDGQSAIPTHPDGAGEYLTHEPPPEGGVEKPA